jgi:hypothetical protein
MGDIMENDEQVMGVVRVRVLDQRGFIVEEEEYTGMISDTGDGFIRETQGDASGWYILVGTEDRIRYLGDDALGRVRVLDQGYPEVGENSAKRSMVYRATFAADTLNARKVNGAVLVYRATKREPETEQETERKPKQETKSLQSVAYARISPVMQIRLDDRLQIQWECQIQK